MSKKIISILLVLVMLTVGLSACKTKEPELPEESNQEEPSGEESSETPGEGVKGTIAVIGLAADHGWLAGIIYYAEQKFEELGVPKGEYLMLMSQNVNEQANHIQEAIDQGVDAIVLEVHSEEVSVAARAIKEAGIPLVLFDRIVSEGTEYDTYIAGDNPAMGTESAVKIGDALDGEGIVAVLNVPSSGSVSTMRVDAFKEKMAADYPKIELVDISADDFKQESGLKTGTDALTTHPKIDAIFSIDDESSLGLLKAIEDAGRKDIKLMSGGGGAQTYYNKIAENNDIELFTATYSPTMIKDAIQVAVDILNGKTPEKEIIIPPTIVSKTNVAEFIDASSPY